jgi:UDP-N-acetylmuramate: L-alanyl-gamma-D-glutamyl-meso-diaminopimelate ligase
VEEILGVLSREVLSGDHVLIMSNGGFGNIHQRLLDALARRRGPA